MGATLDSRYQNCMAALAKRGQQHALRWWDELNLREREQLLTDAESIPWDILDTLVSSHILAKPPASVPAELEPATVYPQAPDPGRTELYLKATEIGRELIRSGKVAALTVAGGQGTRLGFDGPKGAVVVTPVGGKTLFELFAEAIKASRERYGTTIPWYIMTSPANHGQTTEFLQDHDYFGLPVEDVALFVQGMLPAFGYDGKLLLQSKHRLALAPDGHGGTLKALVLSGALNDMQSRGMEVISYFQVDNPLVKPVDPLFIGLHAKTGSEMSTKVTPKADDLEKVGNVCVQQGRVTIIEYSDLPDELAHAKNEDGGRKFNAGNLAIHLLDVAFVERIVARSFQMPFRRAEKIVPFINENGLSVDPTSPNAVKLEALIFDVLPLAKNPLVLEVDRAEEFSPVKNATGVDSLETSQRDQVRRACRWLEAASVPVPRKSDGAPGVTVIISPSFALDAEDVKAKGGQVRALTPGDEILIE